MLEELDVAGCLVPRVRAGRYPRRGRQPGDQVPWRAWRGDPDRTLYSMLYSTFSPRVQGGPMRQLIVRFEYESPRTCGVVPPDLGP